MSTTRIKEDSLSNLPKDIRQEELYPYSPLSVLGLLAQTSQ